MVFYTWDLESIHFVENSLLPLLLPPHLFLLQVDGAQAQVDKVHICSIRHKTDGSLIALLRPCKVPLQVAQVPFQSPDIWILCTQRQRVRHG